MSIAVKQLTITKKKANGVTSEPENDASLVFLGSSVEQYKQ